ncbi:uncharacterized protein PHACADRAFT_265743 [Phanerochaete carnosa HHB-10118-sp]|uniref:Uncharacterized protein n=1 Tax=Phanerochaete carnosa (strain HHB-10118-sp) TaxID=650164 RepID=K5WG81_PHACS|nr:uncharacterized protein PHACADRAFT_265743 [Phanerochaete carnosa HHB-10118-sp]EKM49212.1 hypothetical protein PHACADRAFT_265743 [Phanerochaete carnosa HHB-10118-sp]
MSSLTEPPPTKKEQRKVTFDLPLASSAEGQGEPNKASKPNKSKKLRSKGKSKSLIKAGSPKAKLGASTYLANLLNEEAEREQERRQKAGLEPLVAIVIPNDWVYTPRIYAIEVDEEVEEALIQWTRKVCRIPDEDNLQNSTIFGYALKALRRATGIRRLEVEFAVRENPDKDSESDVFPVFAIFYAYKYSRMHERATQKQVDKLSELLLGRQPRWFVDFQLDGP